ncbi:unnamed protein product [Mytilus coruscus]|uniref:Uncharacterized protein n=1 Tax=Mytilus coruscus TaxID=42192 RepID=A0A6J8BUD7_MYTCO|nr:unnamed protein product [Mytilus coruscus]
MEDRSLYRKQRIVAIYIDVMRNGTQKQKIHVYSEFARLLIAENKVVNRGFVRRIVLKFKSTGSVQRIIRGGRPNILSSNPNVNAITENAMVSNDETTAADLLNTSTREESPDMNPIENLWHEEYSRKYIKPRTQEELVNGVLQFWETITVEKCTPRSN